ncbi:MAG: hypothetical protein IK005_07600 [Paludibacteraceae bacterium]|nr:hypothetical protein [Paludibacteraceae bacterium]
MKNWKLVLLLGLCSLFAVSCSKDDDEDIIDLGRTDIDDIPTGKVGLPKTYGMFAVFPQGTWGLSYYDKFKNQEGYEAEYSRDCIVTYLREDSIYLFDHSVYKTLIYFARFDKEFSSEEEANSFIGEFHYVLEGDYDQTGDNPDLEYEYVGGMDFVQVGKNTGTLIEVRDKFGYYQANYFVYKDGKLYMVTLSLDNEYVTTNSPKYQECISIINSFRIVDPELQ